MAQNDVSQDTAQDLSDKAKNLANRGVGKATQKARKAVKNTAKKLAKKATRKAVKMTAKAVAKILKIILQILLAIWPYVLAIIAIMVVVWILGSFFTDQEYESKAEIDNYQTEDAKEDNQYSYDPENNRYVVQGRSNGNKLFKMFYGYMAQKGYWKVVVDKNGNPQTELMRGDDADAQSIVDRYNREKEFILNSDLLYLLDTQMNATFGNDFYFPEQFIQPVYHDDNYNLKQLTDDKGNLTVQSTKYDSNGKPTNQKETGIWDYGFGSIMEYQQFKEEREKRANLTKTYKWNDETHELELITYNEGEGKPITEGVSGYPKNIYLITKVTNSIGTITNKVVEEWVRTNEPWTKTEKISIPAEKKEYYMETVQDTNSKGQKLYWKYNPLLTKKKDNVKIKEWTLFPVTHQEQRSRWVPTTMEVEQTYQGYVWEKIPRYDGEPNTDGIVGDKYMFDYLTNYESYAPNVVMEKFDIEKRTGKNIEGLNGIWEQQESVENTVSDYDSASSEKGAKNSGTTLDLSAGVTGSQSKYQTAMQFLDLYEIYGKRYGVDPYLLLAMAAQENGGSDYIDSSRYGRSGVGLMQIVKSTGERGITAMNYETGQKESFHLNNVGEFTAENSIHFAAMYMQYLGNQFSWNVGLAIQAYNGGGGTASKAVNSYASASGKSRDEILKNQGDTGWISYIGLGDKEYLAHVLQYYSSSDGGRPFLIDKSGTKYSMDGTIQVGASVIGNGKGLNQNWFTSLIQSIANHWNDLFEDSPTDTFNHKANYTWTKHKNRLSENEYRDFMKLYRTFVEDKPFSEIKEEWTLQDWKGKYKALFENPQIEGVVDEKTLKAYEELLKLFPDGYTPPAEKISKISDNYDGNLIKLAVGKNVVIKAMASGTVSYANVNEGVVEITHSNGVKTRYTGLKDLKVKQGSKVDKGTQLATSNSDLGIAITDNKGNSVDPTPLFLVMGDGTQSYNYSTVLSYIETQKGKPYVFGGATPETSFDCSGLMQWAFKKAGVNLPRTAQQQYNVSLKISESEARPGDLVFFQHTYNAGRPITHVGLYMGNGQFWNANDDGVVISNLSGWRKYNPLFGRIK